jgi:hypothetical protein
MITAVNFSMAAMEPVSNPSIPRATQINITPTSICQYFYFHILLLLNNHIKQITHQKNPRGNHPDKHGNQLGLEYLS